MAMLGAVFAECPGLRAPWSSGRRGLQSARACLWRTSSLLSMLLLLLLSYPAKKGAVADRGNLDEERQQQDAGVLGGDGPVLFE